MHFPECDVCSVVDIILYELKVGICHRECVCADFSPGVPVELYGSIFLPFCKRERYCLIIVDKFVQFGEDFIWSCELYYFFCF